MRQGEGDMTRDCGLSGFGSLILDVWDARLLATVALGVLDARWIWVEGDLVWIILTRIGCISYGPYLFDLVFPPS
jgi:hypothetical protein